MTERLIPFQGGTSCPQTLRSSPLVFRVKTEFAPLKWMHCLILQPPHPHRLLLTESQEFKLYPVEESYYLFPPLNSYKKGVASNVLLSFRNFPIFPEKAALLVHISFLTSHQRSRSHGPHQEGWRFIITHGLQMLWPVT